MMETKKEFTIEKECIYEMDISPSFLNQYHSMKPYAYQILFGEMAQRHLTDVGNDVDETMKHGLAWALISMSLEIERPIDSCMKLLGNTWYSQHRGPYFRRELRFENEDGQLVFQGSTFSVLLDINNRSVYRKKELPFEIHDPTEEFLVEASPYFRTSTILTPVEKRIVPHSHIDCLGHVNNTRYGEYAYDVFTPDEQKDLINLKRMDVYFHSEMRDMDEFTMEKAYQGSQILFRGYNNTKDDAAFNIVMDFK